MDDFVSLDCAKASNFVKKSKLGKTYEVQIVRDACISTISHDLVIGCFCCMCTLPSSLTQPSFLQMFWKLCSLYVSQAGRSSLRHCSNNEVNPTNPASVILTVERVTPFSPSAGLSIPQELGWNRLERGHQWNLQRLEYNVNFPHMLALHCLTYFLKTMNLNQILLIHTHQSTIFRKFNSFPPTK